MILYRILCWIRRDHHYFDERIIDENTTRNYCPCGKWLEFDWSYMGGYKKSMNKLDSTVRIHKWSQIDEEDDKSV